MKKKKKSSNDSLIILVAVLLALFAGSIWYYLENDELTTARIAMPSPVATSTAPAISQAAAIKLVMGTDEVSTWMRLSAAAYGPHGKPIGVPSLAISSETAGAYIIRAYEKMPGQDVTFAYFSVDKQAGTVTSTQ